MSNLVLELRPGEMMIVNGAAIRFRSRTRIELISRARFLFGKQIMSPEQADTPARRIYFALQSAYVGNDEERPRALDEGRRLIGEFIAATTSELAREILTRALAAAESDDCYEAVRLARRIVRHEDTVMRRDGGAADRSPAEPPGGAPPARQVPLST